MKTCLAGRTSWAALGCLREESKKIIQNHVETSNQLKSAASRLEDFTARQKVESKQVGLVLIT